MVLNTRGLCPPGDTWQCWGHGISRQRSRTLLNVLPLTTKIYLAQTVNSAEKPCLETCKWKKSLPHKSQILNHPKRKERYGKVNFLQIKCHFKNNQLIHAIFTSQLLYSYHLYKIQNTLKQLLLLHIHPLVLFYILKWLHHLYSVPTTAMSLTAWITSLTSGHSYRICPTFISRATLK